MSHAITLNLPNNLLSTLERAVQATHQPLEKLLLRALQDAVPTTSDVPPAFAKDLEALELLDNTELQKVVRETVPLSVQRRISRLLRQKQTVTLSSKAQKTLAELEQQTDLVMLRKAHAAALLKFRGQRWPTLAELETATQNGA